MTGNMSGGKLYELINRTWDERKISVSIGFDLSLGAARKRVNAIKKEALREAKSNEEAAQRAYDAIIEDKRAGGPLAHAAGFDIVAYGGGELGAFKAIII